MKDRDLLLLIVGAGGAILLFRLYQTWQEKQVKEIPIQVPAPTQPSQPPQPQQPPGPVTGWYQENRPKIEQGLSGVDQIISGINAISNLFGQIGHLMGGSTPPPDASFGSTDYWWDPISQGYTTTPPDYSSGPDFSIGNAIGSGFGLDYYVDPGYAYTAPVGMEGML